MSASTTSASDYYWNIVGGKKYYFEAATHTRIAKARIPAELLLDIQSIRAEQEKLLEAQRLEEQIAQEESRLAKHQLALEELQLKIRESQTKLNKWRTELNNLQNTTDYQAAQRKQEAANQEALRRKAEEERLRKEKRERAEQEARERARKMEEFLRQQQAQRASSSAPPPPRPAPVLTGLPLLRSMKLETKSHWKEWLRENHADKNPKIDMDLLQRVIRAGRDAGY